jgi:hypothetical protein
LIVIVVVVVGMDIQKLENNNKFISICDIYIYCYNRFNNVF